MSGMRAEHFRFVLDANVGGLRRNLQRGGNDMGRFSSRARKEMRSVNRSISSVGRLLSGGVIGGGAGLAAAFGMRKVIRDTKDFEFAMNQVQAVSKSTSVEFASLREKALELGNSTQYSAGEVADAMRFMAMAGLDADKVLGGITSTLHLAAAGNVELAESADIVTNILTAYGLGIDQLNHATDVLSATVTSSNTDLRQLAQAFKFVAPMASASGISIAETSAALGMLGNAGIQADMAGTALRGMLIKLQSPSNEAKKAMRSVGIEVFDTEGRLKSLSEILKEFEPHTKNVKLFADVFAQRAGPAVLALAKQGGDALQGFAHDVDVATGETERLANVVTKGIRGAELEVKSAAEGMALALGDSGLGSAYEGLMRASARAMRSITADIRAMNAAMDGAAAQGRNRMDALKGTASNSGGGQRTEYEAVAKKIERLEALRARIRGRGALGRKQEIDRQIRVLQAETQLAIKSIDDARAKGEASRHPARQKSKNVPSVMSSAAFASATGGGRKPGFNLAGGKRDGFQVAIQGLSRQIREIELLGRAAGASEGEIARMRAEQRALNSVMTDGGKVTDAQRAEIEGMAAAVGHATDQLQEMELRMDLVREQANIVTDAMTDAFSRWAESGKFSAKEMVQSILIELAKLQMQKNVMGPLNDLLSGGGGLGDFFGGFFANGGPVSANMAHVVGERGPEMFVPRSAGTIVPNHAMGGGGGGGISVTINTELHGRDGGNLEQMLAERDRQLPAQILKTVQNAKSRGQLR